MIRSEAEKLLKRNESLYSSLVRTAQSYYAKGEFEKTLEWIAIAAMFAWENHLGKFTDGALENMALEIGKRLNELPRAKQSIVLPHTKTPDDARKRVLHVATTVYAVGGHTRLIRNWIKSFPEFRHSFLLTDQTGGAIPDFLLATVKESGYVVELPAEADLLTKALMLRQTACGNFDFVLLHHHPNDVVPTVAFASENCPPVAVVNHADHVFWLGASVADLVVDFCSAGKRISDNRRAAKKTTIVPYLVELREPEISRRDARRALQIGENETVLITVGSPFKYKPNEKHDFFATAKKILERNETARIFFIGPNREQASKENLHDRMTFLGQVEDATAYQIAADIYLDGFPLGGGLASLESALLGAYPVFAYDQILMSTARRLIEFEGAVENLKTESEYIDAVTRLIQNPKMRAEKLENLQARIHFLHGREKLVEYAHQTFGEMKRAPHKTSEQPSPESLCEDEDIWLPAVNFATGKSNIPQLLYYGWWNNSPVLGLSDYLRLFAVSVAEGDTRFSYPHLKAWGGTFLSKLKAALR
jgi:hypothetical protein